MTKDEALMMALQALENLDGIDTETECVTIDVGEEITAIREALAQPEQEPVAWMHTNAIGHVYFRKNPQDKTLNPVPLYTSTPASKPWVGLTDEETITQANKELFPGAFARGAIWAQLKLKEKNA